MNSTPLVKEELTRLLVQASQGAAGAADQLLPQVYNELRAIARNQMFKEGSGHTLQATSLVHEAYFKLIAQDRVEWQNRAHFFAIAAQAMRRVLIDHARAKTADKRGGSQLVRVQIEDMADQLAATTETDVDLVALDEALKELTEMDETQGRLVELKYFGGLTNEEIAEVLGVSLATVKREWSMARAWLHRRMTEELNA